LPIGFDFSRIAVHGKTPVGIQAKLTVGAAGDAFEQEADRVADQVMRAPSSDRSEVQSNISTHPPASAANLQTKPHTGGSGGIAAPPIVHEVLRSPGQPLDAATRAFMEPRFGHDFGKVRVHADAKAGESARAVNALAYTVGCNIVFGVGRYAPATQDGSRLIAHELTHVRQQSYGQASGLKSPHLQRAMESASEETALLEQEMEEGADQEQLEDEDAFTEEGPDQEIEDWADKGDPSDPKGRKGKKKKKKSAWMRKHVRSGKNIRGRGLVSLLGIGTSGIYTHHLHLDFPSLHRRRVKSEPVPKKVAKETPPPVVKKVPPPVVKEVPPPVVKEVPPAVVKEVPPPVAKETPPPVVKKVPPPVVKEIPPPVVKKVPPPVTNKVPPPVRQKPPPPCNPVAINTTFQWIADRAAPFNQAAMDANMAAIARNWQPCNTSIQVVINSPILVGAGPLVVAPPWFVSVMNTRALIIRTALIRGGIPGSAFLPPLMNFSQPGNPNAQVLMR
jgi:hypothetical protein